MRQEWGAPEVQVGRHALEESAQDIRPGEDATGALPMIILVLRVGAVTGGGHAPGTILPFAVMAF